MYINYTILPWTIKLKVFIYIYQPQLQFSVVRFNLKKMEYHAGNCLTLSYLSLAMLFFNCGSWEFNAQVARSQPAS